jgi:hypothetical protein
MGENKSQVAGGVDDFAELEKGGVLKETFVSFPGGSI